ncbi:pilus assembly protein PilZ [Hyphomicrobium methylovorum]|uniref:PilZ domain-containing protein n=1 Tax=Hyphomicrobium methylovorum TaxID=84 RepID=UPI0015E6B60F|nr:PilZ domain-containing protein [Hyphomicrobium methylovorum]MBA2125104.1 pilus assembly protein PilZ [Hyphomicrobium methylovorum]
MKSLRITGQFLRRNDERLPLQSAAILECRGVSRRIAIVDFSSTGLRADHVTGLAAGDAVTIALTPELAVEGTIVWLVWHKAGIRFSRPLANSDPVHAHLAAEAAKLVLARSRAVTALAQRDASRAQAESCSDPNGPRA